MPRTSPSRFVKLPARPGAWAILVTLLLGVCVVAQSSVAQTGSVIFVTTTVDKISSTGGCSLQEAIYSANLENNIAVDSINSDGSEGSHCGPRLAADRRCNAGLSGRISKERKANNIARWLRNNRQTFWTKKLRYSLPRARSCTFQREHL